MLELTPLQKKHLPAIEWLISDSRAEGKTFLLAFAFFQKALNNKGRWIRVFDHFPDERAKENLLKTISYIVANIPNKKIIVDFRRVEFRII